MDEMTVYLICRLDAIGRFVAFFMGALPLIIGIILIISGVIAEDLTEGCKKTFRTVGICLLVFSVFGAMLKTCIPTTQEMIMIKLAPKITNVENLKMFKENIIEITKEIRSALK